MRRKKKQENFVELEQRGGSQNEEKENEREVKNERRDRKWK